MALNKLNVVPIGGTARAVATLKSILKRNDITIPLVIIMLGYKDEELHAEEMIALCVSNNTDYICTNKITAEHVKQIREMHVDLMLGIGVWRSILSEEFIGIPRLGYLGLHGTPLPRLRGWAGINWQIINGEKEIRMHALRLAKGVDDGELVCDSTNAPLVFKIDIDNEKHLKEIFEEYEEAHISACHAIIELASTDRITFKPQSESDATYSCHRGEDDGEINWDQPSKNVFNFIRAQSRPYKGAFTYYKGNRVHIHRVAIRDDYQKYEGRIPGKVVSIDSERDSSVILTNDSAIEVFDIEVVENSELKSPAAVFNSVRARCMSKAEHFADVVDKLLSTGQLRL